MIKTEDLIANVEKEISLKGGTHVKIKNLSDSTVYVSKYANVVAEADGVKSVQGGSAEILTDVAVYQSQNYVFDWYGTIYALADRNCKIEIETTNNANFRQIVKGGEYSSSSLDAVLKSGATYQLGVLTKDINLILPEMANNDIEVDFAIADTTYSINCDYLQLDVVANTYYQVIFSYDKSLSRWFASVISSDYISTTTAEVSTDETT